MADPMVRPTAGLMADQKADQKAVPTVARSELSWAALMAGH